MRDFTQERQDIDAAVAGWTLPKAFATATERFPDVRAVEWRSRDGGWEGLTFAHYREVVRDLTLGLARLGFAPGEAGLILAGNVPEHVIADLALVHARGASVSLYSTLAPEQIVWIANHCAGTVALVEDEAQLATMRRIKPEMPALRTVVLMRGQPTGEDWVVGWDDVLAAGRASAAEDPAGFDRLWQQIQPEDRLSLIYTSGTTGSPKGVTYTHRNVLWTVESVGRLAGRELLDDGRLISYLPLAHVAERVTSHWSPLWQCAARGATGTVRYCPDMHPAHVATCWRLGPRSFVSVPRVWEKLHAAIHAGAAAEPDERRRATVLRALEVAHQVAGMRHHGEQVPAELDAAHARFAPIYADIRARLGLDRCRWAITSAAPTPLDLELFFAGIGLPLRRCGG